MNGTYRGLFFQEYGRRRAEERALQGTHENANSHRSASLALLAMLLLFLPVAQAAGNGAAISGVVRNAQGVAQMGALVQVLTGDSVTAGTAFTDLHGRYLIANLTPGRYLVRASATLFVPATRSNLQLATGASAVVNLTLAALFDTASWLPAQRRHADDPDDDWKWALRSTATRPILRIVEDGTLIEVSSSALETSRPIATKARATVSSGDGEFGGGGVHNILAIHRAMDDGGDAMMRVDIGSTRVPAAYGPSTELDAGYERRVGLGGAARTVVSYKAHPELAAAGSPTGLEVLQFTSAQRMALGDQLEVEVGGRLTGVHTSGYVVASHPFLRLTAHPTGSWTLQYRLAEDRELQGFEDVTSDQSDVPVALVRNGRLALQSGRHQEATLARKVGHATVSAVYYHDAFERTAISGGGASGPGETKASEIAPGMLVDPTTGSFKALASGYRSNGVRVDVSSPLTVGMWVAAEYSSGDAMASETGGTVSFAQALAGLKARQAQAATIALKGHIVGTGTRMRASYRWQSASLVTAVDPYSALADQAFFSCMIRQPIHLGHRMPQGLDATIDVTNLLAEGYRPFLSADGQTLYFAQAPRTIQAGLSFSF